jgi:hypothetical protein
MKKNPTRISSAIFISLAVGVLIGLIFAAFIMHSAWEPNPQQTDPEHGSIHWNYWLPLGFFWFTMIGGGLSLIFSVVSAGVILFYKILQDA